MSHSVGGSCTTGLLSVHTVPNIRAAGMLNNLHAQQPLAFFPSGGDETWRNDMQEH